MRIRFYAVLGSAALALLMSGPAMAKPAHHAKPHRVQSGRHYAQSHYSYRSASVVREAFADAPRGRWMRPPRHFDEYAYEARREVLENLRGDFTGGVGYGADGFMDGYGQMHYFVGSFRGMNPLPHGPYMPSRGRAF